MAGSGINVGYKVEGLKELDELLAELPSKIAGTVLRQAVMDSAKPALWSAIYLAPYSLVYRKGSKRHPEQARYPGMLKKNIILRSQSPKAKNDFNAEAVVGFTKRAYYGSFVEFGTSKMSARPFLRPAADATREESVAKFGDYLAARIAKAHERLKKAG